MPFTFSMKDTYRQSVEAASGGKQTVLYDSAGIPSIMNILPTLTYKDVGLGASTEALPAWVVNNKVLPEIYIGTYLATVHNGRAYSLPGQDPAAYTTHDQAVSYCRAKGPGWHCVTNAEYAAIALWCKKNGYYPRGNNNYGCDHTAPHEKGRVTYRYGANGETIGRTATGTGPVSWNHDGTNSGIADLNGDVWEWSTGIRTVEGEIQIIQDNNAAADNIDLTSGSQQWKAILQSGALVAPGTAGTLKIEGTGANGSGAPRFCTTITSKGVDDTTSMYTVFKDVAVGSGIAIPDRLKALAVYPSDATDHGSDGLWIRNAGERLFFRGGRWGITSGSGVFALNGHWTRSYSVNDVGFRAAFVDNL